MQLQVADARSVFIDTPCVLFFPRPCAHVMKPGALGVELVCGTVDLGIAEQSPLIGSLPDFLVIPLVEMPAIGSTLELLYREAFGAGVGRQAALDRLLEYFLIHVLRHLVAQQCFTLGALATMTDPRMTPALHAMHERPAHPWTLEQLAALANMSRARPPGKVMRGQEKQTRIEKKNIHTQKEHIYYSSLPLFISNDPSYNQQQQQNNKDVREDFFPVRGDGG